MPTQDQIDRARQIIDGCREPIRYINAHPDADGGFSVYIGTEAGDTHHFEIDAFGKLPHERVKRFAMLVVVDADDETSAFEDVAGALKPGPGGRTFGVYGSDPVEIPAEDAEYWTQASEHAGRDGRAIFRLEVS